MLPSYADARLQSLASSLIIYGLYGSDENDDDDDDDDDDDNDGVYLSEQFRLGRLPGARPVTFVKSKFI